MGPVTTEPATAQRRTLSVRMWWAIGLLAFAAGCYAIFGWLWDAPFHDEAGNQLVFYAGVQEGHFVVLGFVLGGLAVGTALLMFICPVLWRLDLRHWVWDTLVTLVAGLLGFLLFLAWLAASHVVLLASLMNPLVPVTAPDGQRVLMEHSGFDGDLLGIWVPHSRFMYVEVPNSSHRIGGNRRSADCTLNAEARPWILTCQGNDLVLDGTGR